MKRFWPVCVLMMVLIFGFAFPCFAHADTIVIGSGAEAIGLDPRIETDVPSFERINVINEALMKFDLEMNLAPLLATSWELSDDGLMITFELRQGVTWHDGKPFTAEDVKYTYEWVLDPANGALNRGLYVDIESIEVVNDHLIRFHLGQPFAFLLNNIARMPIVPKHDGDRADFRQKPLGTGPYKFVSWTRDDRMILKANDDYWAGKPLTANIIFRAIPEDATRLMAFEAGEIDMYQGGMVPRELPRLERDPKVVVQRAPGTGYTYLGFHTQVDYLSDPRVRQAISHLFNREAIVAMVMGGIGMPGIGPVSMTLPWFNPNLVVYEYDLIKAEQLLAEAGYPGGGFTLNFYTNENPIRIRLGEILQQQCARVGINVNVVIEEWGAYLTRIQETDDFDIFILGWSGQLDPDRAMIRQFHTDGSNNYGKFSNTRLDYLLDYGRLIDPESQESIDVYREAQEIVVNEVPYCFINYSEEVGVNHPNVKGWMLHPYGAATWQDAYLFYKEK